jgi:AAT family amino acid transporter
VLLFVLALTVVNLLGVRNYGRFEFWFAAIKVAAIIAFLVVGVLAIVGLIPAPGDRRGQPRRPGRLRPPASPDRGRPADRGVRVRRHRGGRDRGRRVGRPARNISRIVRQVMVRILVFYVGSIFVIVAVLPWNSKEVLAGPSPRCWTR